MLLAKDPVPLLPAQLVVLEIAWYITLQNVHIQLLLLLAGLQVPFPGSHLLWYNRCCSTHSLVKLIYGLHLKTFYREVCIVVQVQLEFYILNSSREGIWRGMLLSP